MMDASEAREARKPNVSPSAGISLLMVTTVGATLSHFLAPYAAHFRALGWRVDAAANGATREPRVLEAFDNVYELPFSRSIRDVRGLARARRALIELLATGPDIVHVHTPIAGLLTRFLAGRLPLDRRPMIAYTAHGFHFHEGGHRATNLAFLTAERIAGRWADRLIVINDEDEAAAIRHRIVSSGRLVRMPGVGLDTRRYSPSAVAPHGPAGVRREAGIPVDSPIFAIIGELNRNKRQRDAIAALPVMRQPGAHLVLAGEGRHRPLLERQAADLGVQDRVHLLGVVDDVRPVMSAAMGLIVPSKREGLSRSVMEALSLEVPVIASAARGNRELVGTDSGLLFETGDIRGLSEAMDWLIDHPSERRAMGLRGRERMVGQYDLALLVRLHDKLYREMLAERSRRSG